MSVKHYVKKPIPIEAVQWTGTNTKELMEFSKDVRFIYHDGGDGNVSTEMYVQTLEGDLYAKIGDYIVKGNHHDTWPVKKEIFEETYEEIKS